MSALARTLGIEKARTMLAVAVRTDEVKKIRDVAVAMRAYARTQKAGKAIALDAGEIILRADARLGELARALPKAPDGKRRGVSGSDGRTQKRIALAEVGVSKQRAAEYEKVASLPAKHLDAYIDAERKAGRAPTTSGAVTLARMPEEARTKVLAKLGDLPDLRAAARAIRRDEALERVGTAGALSGQFRVFYADPPWQYGDSGYGNGPAEFHYPTMSIDDLCALPIAAMALDDAVLFLWVTSPLLEDAFAVIDAWGFAYKASFVWHKVKHNVGHYNSVRHEFLLIATRGSCVPDDRRLVESVQTIERGAHSAKPERFREIIDQLYPHGPRVELFARHAVKGGWSQWGNQI